jgi:branched-chain amino acid transport system substrate-binding protein
LNRRHISAVAGVTALLAASGPTACARSSADSSSSGEITIGASIPLTGALASFGSFQKWGYQHAVDKFNAAGGISINGEKRKVKLIILDDETNPNTTVANMTKLITGNHVDAVLGSCTDSLVEPGALIADRNGVPMVTPCAATNTFGATKKWAWAWDLFFDSGELTETPFNTVDELKLATNHKVAIIHSNGRNETVIGDEEWPKWAAKHGWTVTFKSSLAPDTTQFTSAIEQAKATGADMLLTVFPPPAAIALRKQLSAASYSPKILVMEEGGEPEAFAKALGKLADGVMVGGYWDPSFPYPGAATLREQFEKQTGQTFSQHIADTDAAAEVLLDAITRAGTLDKAKINAEIAKTDKTYVVGPIKFGDDHTCTLSMVQEQWQSGKNVIIAPKDRATADAIFPLS